ncbi:hypothetical protein J3Q64DRAFT_1766441 [Phycomyces blakesleeanus]|uniref:RanBD1 domain-containing protein n=2 Tax=Phycomyces blakesleeanus TaxID=4837 RepID=A0A167LW66_PHYB8|nr:hypothetical protein PHYBLDRAFT_78453 [Phycomyces blakesleeanus NRRL 1555(-)]OAD71217.1 hypothetical protein PHYBLDRAFT_78453 [Phycomyces blakesleeanus NRRL 1555(-)]|eukprot:XP_018289257.1 hypothetical protein PHYBLDRAFT_78453 [Phycomyces blakesleeanus NRRL 1555(-)]
MSSPPNSMSDLDDAASNKKRERAQSVEPAPAHVAEIEEKSINVSAPKKTKRDETSPASVSTIRQNLKDMTTSDSTGKMLSASSSIDGDDETMRTIAEEENNVEDVSMCHSNDKKRTAVGEEEGCASEKSEENGGTSNGDLEENQSFPRKRVTRRASQSEDTPSSQTDSVGEVQKAPCSEEESKKDKDPEYMSKVMALFGGKGDSDDWGEFAEEPEKKEPKAQIPAGKPKYAFGTSSGFGSKGWAATHQTAPVSQKSSFGSSTASAFGGFSPPTTPLSSSKVTPSFGSFAKASASPFALAAASGNSNALSASPASNVLSSGNKNDTNPEEGNVTEEDQSESVCDASDALSTGSSAFGESGKPKIPIARPTEVKTGEEDERTVYQTKAKLLALDTQSGNWKERGSGTLHINMKDTNRIGAQQHTRLVMRADSVYRVILNLALFPGMKVFIMQEKFVRFAGFETETKENGETEAVLVNYALRVRDPSAAQELCDQITMCIPHGSKTSAGP